MTWFVHLKRVPAGHLLSDCYYTQPTKLRKTPGQIQDPLHQISGLAWEHLGIPQEQLESVARDIEPGSFQPVATVILLGKAAMKKRTKKNK